MESSDHEVAIFAAARQLSPEARQAYLDATCVGNVALRHRIEELLRAIDEASHFLLGPARGATRPLEGSMAPDLSESAGRAGEKPGSRIGRYRLIESIGQGGCGVVYLAEQEEPVRRRVAVKVIKLGMDTESVIARFEAERQALAMMDHPHIAKVLDAGSTDTGRPYFVMELVRGDRITDYCDQANLATSARLELFIQVCHAIQHAHQKGIIHRDIKPSNILVTANDGRAVPKVIDFGIAKATQGRLTDQTLFTALEQFVGTPAYMSPEQAVLASTDIDTRSDIYSLGVLLYELLTGQPPFDAKELLSAGLDGMRRTIRETEPIKPSTRLAQRPRMTESQTKLQDPKAKIDADLDWIVMKCLEKDRGRRYETANGLAMDVQRYLAQEPVVARSPGKLYRFQKLVRRHRLAFAAASAVMVALWIGLATSTWLLFREAAARRRAVKAEEKARTAAQRSQRVADFLKKILKGVGPSVALGQDTTLLRKILDETAKTVGQELVNQPEVAVELCLTLAETYHDLGLYREMETVARQGLELARAKMGPENEGVALSLTSLGDALQHLGEMHLGSLGEAEKCSRAGLVMSRKVLGRDNLKVALALQHLANVLLTQGRAAEAEPMQREALALFKKLGSDETPEVAKLLSDLANQLTTQPERLAEAESLIHQALAIQRKVLGDPHPEVAKSLRILGSVLAGERKWTNAEAMFHQSLAMWSQLQANDRPDLIYALSGLAEVLTSQGRHAEAEANLRQILAMQRRIFGDEHSDVVASLDWLGTLLSAQGRLQEAEATLCEALAIRRKVFGNDHPAVAASLYSLGGAAQAQGRLDEAEALYNEVLALEQRLPGQNDSGVAWALESLARLFEAEDRLADAEALLRQAVVLKERAAHEMAQDASFLAEPIQDLVRVLGRESKLAEADAMRREAVELGNAQILNQLAWRLAISSDPQFRDGVSAVMFAEKAVAATDRKDPNLLDTLAAAYAEARQFTNAVHVQREAMVLAKEERDREGYAARLKLYEGNSPFREQVR